MTCFSLNAFRESQETIIGKKSSMSRKFLFLNFAPFSMRISPTTKTVPLLETPKTRTASEQISKKSIFAISHQSVLFADILQTHCSQRPEFI